MKNLEEKEQYLEQNKQEIEGLREEMEKLRRRIQYITVRRCGGYKIGGNAGGYDGVKE